MALRNTFVSLHWKLYSWPSLAGVAGCLPQRNGLNASEKGLNKLGDDGKSYYYTFDDVSQVVLLSCRLDILRTVNVRLDICRLTRCA